MLIVVMLKYLVGMFGKDSPFNIEGSINSNIDNHLIRYSRGYVISGHRLKGENNNLLSGSGGADLIHNVACSNGSSAIGTCSVTSTRALSTVTVSNNNNVITVGPVCDSLATDSLIPGTKACPITSVNESPGVIMPVTLVSCQVLMKIQTSINFQPNLQVSSQKGSQP